MEQEEIIIPRWLLERIEDTLQIQYNINLDKKTGETCQDRNIKESLNGVRKLLRGEGLTGGERLERFQPSLPSNLDEAAEKYSGRFQDGEDKLYAFHGFKAGAEWMNKQMEMPNSTKLISEWHNVKTILEEKDFRGDEWRLAYNAFMFGFSRGINTQKTEK